MLTIQDLIEISYIPQETEISLELFVDFYEQYLCKHIFVFELANGEVVKLFFRDATELFHVSGIDHIYTGYPMDGTRFIKEIKDARNIADRWLKSEFQDLFKDFLSTREKCEDMPAVEIVVTRKQKDVWKKQLLSKLEAEKDSLKTMVAALDPYWVGKIVGESLRNYGKDFAMEDIERELVLLQSNQ